MSFKFNIKKHGDGFYVRMRSYAEADKAKYGKLDAEYVERMLPKNEWAAFGFDLSMTIDKAKAHALSLNAGTRLMDANERKARINNSIAQERKELLKSAYLPSHVVAEFEKKLEKESLSKKDFRESKPYYHWRTAMRIIASLDMPPSEWADESKTIFRAMEGLAPDTINRQIHIINAYGKFYSKKMGKFFEDISKPKGPMLGHLSDAYSEKTNDRTKESKGITLRLMDKLANTSELTQAEKDWCVVCLGLGLRPSEVSVVIEKDPKKFQLKKESVIIYQEKLKSLARQNRFKEVKITHPFQKAAYDLVKAGKELQAPSVYKIKKILGDEYKLYTFRKGYTDIMISFGEPLERISLDMGHSTVQRTWKSYRPRIAITRD